MLGVSASASLVGACFGACLVFCCFLGRAQLEWTVAPASDNSSSCTTGSAGNPLPCDVRPLQIAVASLSACGPGQPASLLSGRRSTPPPPPSTMAALEVVAFSESVHQFCQPCVDCGLWTGCWCDYCYARERMPNSRWEPRQHTPLCTGCDALHGACHYCRGVQWCTPIPHGPHVTDDVAPR